MTLPNPTKYCALIATLNFWFPLPCYWYDSLVPIAELFLYLFFAFLRLDLAKVLL